MALPPPGQDFSPWAPGRITRVGDKITGTLMLNAAYGLTLESAEIVYDGQGLTVVFGIEE